MTPQIRRHVFERVKQGGESPLITPYDRVVGINHVKTNGAVVGIDDDLHRIPDVVEVSLSGSE